MGTEQKILGLRWVTACRKAAMVHTVLAKVHDMAAEQDHEGVKEVEAVGCRGMDCCTDSDAILDQPFHHCHHLAHT